MKYCISLYRNHPLQDTVDEMIVKYNAKDKTMFEFIEQHINQMEYVIYYLHINQVVI